MIAEAIIHQLTEDIIKIMKIGFMGLLALLFIGLKLGGVIGWSWWWVLSPLWISAVIGLLILTLIIWAHK